MSGRVYLNELGIINALGSGKASVRRNMLAGQAAGMHKVSAPISGKTFFAGEVLDPLPPIPAAFAHMKSRNCQLILAALQQIEPAIRTAIAGLGAARIGVVMGSSTSGVAETELAIKAHHSNGKVPDHFNYRQHEIGTCAEFVADYFRLKGPAYSISTACSSSAKVFASARGLLAQDFCDAVIVGGADSLCELTLSGFKSLEAIADEVCNPFSVNRKGINVGEAAAVFLMSRQVGGVEFKGAGDSSDAYHMSAPAPSGDGARRAMLAALADAQLEPAAIGYLNLHGTATRLNDVMESHAVHAVFGSVLPVSSSKPLTGHTLGAAGATEAGLCWLLLTDADDHQLVSHLYDGQNDPALSTLNLCTSSRSSTAVNYVMSNSFAFGGNNTSIILGRLHDA